jgi:hypothetical protein
MEVTETSTAKRFWGEASPRGLFRILTCPRGVLRGICRPFPVRILVRVL